MSTRVWMMSMWIVRLCSLRVNAEVYGYLPYCPGSDQPVVITESVLNKEIFFKVQVNYPNSIYRRTYYFDKAVDGIGTDPHMDFKNKKTLVYQDGYLDSTSFILSRLAVLGYPASDYNVISVETITLSSFIYPVVARCVPQMGNITARVLNGLRKYGLKPKDIEILGYSMGGQAAGFVGKRYYELTGDKVARITALDPAGPCFRNVRPDQALHPTDAHFVQVIHVSGQGFGNDRPLGHIDFYVNGGDNQYVFDPHQPLCEDFCAHTLAIAQHISFIKNPHKFIGIKCKSVQQAKDQRCYENTPHETNFLGANADPNKTGVYFLPTTANIPFYTTNDVSDETVSDYLTYDNALSNVEHFFLSEASRAA